MTWDWKSELNVSVGLALGWHRHYWSNGDWDWRGAPTEDDEIGPLKADSNWSPSTDWGCGGPIIEMAKISLGFMDESPGSEWEAISRSYYGYEGPEGEHVGYGETPLIAAMRAFVESDGR